MHTGSVGPHGPQVTRPHVPQVCIAVGGSRQQVPAVVRVCQIKDTITGDEPGQSRLPQVPGHVNTVGEGGDSIPPVRGIPKPDYNLGKTCELPKLNTAVSIEK